MRIERPDPGPDPAELLVGWAGDRDKAPAQIESVGGEVIERVGRSALAVEIGRADIDDFCALARVIAVEPNADDVELL